MPKNDVSIKDTDHSSGGSGGGTGSGGDDPIVGYNDEGWPVRDSDVMGSGYGGQKIHDTPPAGSPGARFHGERGSKK